MSRKIFLNPWVLSKNCEMAHENGKPSLRFLTCKDGMRFFRLSWRHSKSNHTNWYFNFLWRCPSSIVLTREYFVFLLLLKTFPHLFAHLLFLHPQKENRASLWSLHFDVVGTADLIFYVCPLVTRIFISKILDIESSGCFIVIDCVLDCYLFW